jgi:anti-sigma factor (TIGR02949 family)
MTLTCRELIDVLDDYLDGRLAGEELDALERHLAGCEPCRAYLATYRRTRALGARAGRVEMPEEMKSRLRQFLRERLG